MVTHTALIRVGWLNSVIIICNAKRRRDFLNTQNFIIIKKMRCLRKTVREKQAFSKSLLGKF